MHARIDQLLSIRDGEPAEADLRTHVEHCRECAAAVARFREVRERLLALPQVESKPGAWMSIETRLAARERSMRRRTVASRAIAAASVAAMALFAALYEGGNRSTNSAVPAVVRAPADRADVALLLGRSLELEQALAALPSRPAVERAATSMPIDAMQARVQWIDHQLSVTDADGAPTADAERLWRERVEVMSSLVRLRYVEARRLAL